MTFIVTKSYAEQACAVTGMQSKQLQKIYIINKYDKQIYHKLLAEPQKNIDINKSKIFFLINNK